jgi:dual specificity phosphatase 12
MIEHEPSTGQAQFQYFKRDNTELKACALLFLEPMDWMSECVNTVEGKLMCPGCCSKIGAFNWYGMQCSCGSWQSPAFTIARKNVDEMKSVQREC